MPIIRVVKNKNYTIMSNYHLKDKKLSLKAKGLLSVMLSLPDNWDFSLAGLKIICKESINSINGAIHELEDNQYMKRNKVYENGKIKDWEYIIYEEPNLFLKNEDIENEDIGIEEQVNTNNNINTNNIKENKTKENNVINVDVETLLDRIKEIYKKNGCSIRFNRSGTKKKLLSMYKNRTIKNLTPTYILLAYNQYFAERKLGGEIETKYIKQSDTFLTEKVFDCAEKCSEVYKNTMIKYYGEDWSKLKFVVVDKENIPCGTQEI